MRNEPFFETDEVRIGIFRAHPDEPDFDTAGLPSLPTFVFPRSAVWIEHEGHRPFVADPNVITLYNPGALYRRRAVAEIGDRCEWFQVTGRILREAVRRQYPDGLDLEAPFRWLRVQADPELYLQQRLLTRYVRRRPRPDPAVVEEVVISLLERVLWLARSTQGATTADTGPGASRRHRELIERARGLLDLRYREGTPLAELSDRLGASKHHLCRVFKRGTGLTIHQYQTRLRLADALEQIPGDGRLIDAAFQLGFSSHSHFTESFRRIFGIPPSRFRTMPPKPLEGAYEERGSLR